MKLGVLGSGKGSNFSAILSAIDRGELPAAVPIVISDVPGAGILELARARGIRTEVVECARYRTRYDEETEQRLANLLLEAGVDLVVLAGFMRLVKAPMLAAFPHRIINIHPSLLPRHPGLESWKMALTAGDAVAGCTVHYVDAGMDTGAVVAQREVPVLPGDTAESLHARIQHAEHALYPAVIAQLTADRERSSRRA